MKMFMERIDPPPPPVPLHDEEQIKLIAEKVTDDRWVKSLIDNLSGILRDVKH